MKHEFDNGKYAVEMTKECNLIAYRHGEFWQDVTGNNLVYWMLVEIENLKDQLNTKRVDVELVIKDKGDEEK